jgi:hypothetical protein
MTDTAVLTTGPKRRIAFFLLVGFFSLLFLTLNVILYPFPFILLVIVGWFNPEPFGIHLLQDMMYGALNGVMLAGILLQFHKPERKVAALQMVILLLFGSMIGEIIEGSFIALHHYLAFLQFSVFIGGIALLHPARQEILRFGRPGNPELLALVGVAAAPLLIYAVNQWSLQLAAGIDEVASTQRYSVMAYSAVDILLLGLLAGFKTTGWRIPAWGAGFIAIVLGLPSVVFTGQASSVGPLWGILAIIWGLAFVGVAEWKRRKGLDTPLS